MLCIVHDMLVNKKQMVNLLCDSKMGVIFMVSKSSVLANAFKYETLREYTVSLATDHKLLFHWLPTFAA